MTYLRKILLGPLLQDDEIFGAVSQKVMGVANFSMPVQDSLPIGTTIA
jgi:hypothetical protein